MKFKFLKGKIAFTKPEIVLFTLFLLFSFGLMSKTFGRDPQGNMLIATKAWSDFAATIPLIRSFSFGSNFPPQYPIFAGPSIRYHFIFYSVVGMLEKIGLPINLALNIPSALGFTLLLIAIYLLTKNIFKNKIVGVLSVLLFLFNGSFSFLEFFKIHPLSLNTINEIAANKAFPSFGPYDGKIVSAFWNLNIFTNQRHLAFAYSVFLLLLLYFYKINNSKLQKIGFKRIVLISLIIGLFPFVHYAVFGMMEILLVAIFLFFPKTRKPVFIIGLLSFILAIPQILYMGTGQENADLIKFGYLIQDLSFVGFVKYWFYNLGIASVLAPIGFLLSDKNQRKILFPFLSLFIVGNAFQFSPEIAANHKFFNLFIIGANMFASHFLVKLWQKSIYYIPMVSILFFLSTFSGVIDLFPIINDSYITVADVPNNKSAEFIKENTPKTSVFLNSSFLYDSASIAGRKIYMGWPYFSWSAGYDTASRDDLMKQMLNPRDMTSLCSLLKKERIDYVEISRINNFQDTPVNKNFFSSNFTESYNDPAGHNTIYKVADSCGG